MTNRIDHFAEARRLVLATETRDWNQESPYVDRRLAAAQVHATLALAEQQRIANLIALAESGRTTTNGARSALSGLYSGRAEDGSANMAIRPDIAAALGIEVKS